MLDGWMDGQIMGGWTVDDGSGSCRTEIFPKCPKWIVMKKLCLFPPTKTL